MTLNPYQELTITSKVQECCGREFAAKLGEFDFSNNYVLFGAANTRYLKVKLSSLVY